MVLPQPADAWTSLGCLPTRATLSGPRLGSIQVIHGWELGAIGVAP
jgi:hypothetical protein